MEDLKPIKPKKLLIKEKIYNIVKKIHGTRKDKAWEKRGENCFASLPRLPPLNAILL